MAPRIVHIGLPPTVGFNALPILFAAPESNWQPDTLILDREEQPLIDTVVKFVLFAINCVIVVLLQFRISKLVAAVTFNMPVIDVLLIIS